MNNMKIECLDRNRRREKCTITKIIFASNLSSIFFTTDGKNKIKELVE